MKNVVIFLSLSFSILFSAVSLASDESYVTNNTGNVDTVVVTSSSVDTNYEIYNVEYAEQALENVMNLMLESLPSAVPGIANNRNIGNDLTSAIQL